MQVSAQHATSNCIIFLKKLLEKDIVHLKVEYFRAKCMQTLIDYHSYHSLQVQ